MNSINKPTVVIFDLYGTLVKFGVMHHPFRALLKWAREQGRSSRGDDARQLMTVDADLFQLARHLGINAPDSSDENDMVDFRALHEALSKQLRKELENKGIDHLFDSNQKIRDGLHKILALRPVQLKRAISEATAIHTKTEEAKPIPVKVTSKEPLEPSRLNLYGIYPEDLNTWERPYAEYLDSTIDTVLWWHRNQPTKPWAVCMPLPGQPKFFPDFIVGIKDRKLGKGILLMETKRDINDQAGNAKIKAQAEHPDYGNVLMIYWEDKRVWRVVEYDPKADKNFLDRALRPELFASY